MLLCDLNALKGMVMFMRTGKFKSHFIRFICAVFAVMLCIQSPGAFANASSADALSTEEQSFINAIENGASGKINVWGKWNNAISLQSQGNYQGAIAGYRQVAPHFKKEGATNMALLFQHLGECYVAANDYRSGAICYKRSAYYWSQAQGQEETARYYKNIANSLKTDVRLYLKTTDARFNKTKFFGAPNENQNGIILGTTWGKGPDFDTSAITGVKHDLELLYVNYGADLTKNASDFQTAKENNTLLQIALQPSSGLQAVQNNSYLIELAKYLESTGCRILLRFANEMNDQTSPWYTANYNEYIEKFRIVASVFKTYAPSVGIVWAPNFYPDDTIDLYYPGDEYVDYVGLSVYKEYTPETDPLRQGVDRGRWSNILDRVYDTYGERKPIIVSESGCSYFSVKTQSDITAFAVKQMKDYYTYLPIKYPNLKMAVLFNKEDAGGRQFLLSRNNAVLEAYKAGITSSPRFISNSSPQPTVYYSELQNWYTVPAAKVELCSYISEPLNEIGYVIYTVNGVPYTSYGIPYAVPVDFSAQAGQTLSVDVRAYRNDIVVAQESFSLQVVQ